MVIGRTTEGLIKIKTDDPMGLRAVPCACCCVLPQRDISVQYFGPPIFDYPTTCNNSSGCEYEGDAGSSRLSEIVQPPTSFDVPYIPEGEILTYCFNRFQTQQTYPIYSSGCEFYLNLNAGFTDTGYRYCDCVDSIYDSVTNYRFNFRIATRGQYWSIALGYFQTFRTQDGDTIGSEFGDCNDSPSYTSGLPQMNVLVFTDLNLGQMPKNTPIYATNGGYFLINW